MSNLKTILKATGFAKISRLENLDFVLVWLSNPT